MADFNTKSTQQWRLQTAVITSDRGHNEDVKNLISELILYENIYVPFVTGRVAIADNSGLFNRIGPMGTERLTIEIRSETPGEDHPDNTGAISGKTFVMKGIENQVKSNAEKTASMVIFELIEEHAIASNVQKISRTVKDNAVLEILKCTSDMGISVDIKDARPPKQTKWKGYIPYLSPLETVNWLMERATNEKEMPYVLYSNIHTPSIKLASLDVLMGKTPFNQNTPYVYSSATVQGQEYQTGAAHLNDLPLKHWHINSMKASKLQNQLEIAQKGGATGSRMTVTNIHGSNPIILSKHNSITDTISKMSSMFRGGTQNVYDQQYNVVGAGPMHENDAAQIHKIVSENTYTQDYKSWHFEETIDEYMPTLTANAVKALMQKNTFTVEITGAELLKAQKGVGDTIRLMVYADNPDLENAEQQIDRLKSGTFLITAIAHQFRIPSHKVSMQVTKFAVEDSLG
jgi:hypothetical protein